MHNDKPSVSHPMGLKFLFRALRHRNYRLFFCGQSISLVGTWMQTIAASWLVYRLTHSAFLLGIAGFFGQIPIPIFAPFAGVLADRWDRRRVLLVTQTLAMLQALILAFLVLAGNIAVWQIIALAVFLGLVSAFDMPVRQAFVVEMVEEREDLVNAIALNSSIVNAARLIGPSIAGILIAAVGEGMCFLLNGISYLAVIFALMAMKIAQKKPSGQNSNILQELKEGAAYVFGLASIRRILLFLSLVSLVGMSFTVLIPVFAKEILGAGPAALGFLMGAVGVGALGGTLFLAWHKDIYGLEKEIFLAVGIFGLGLVIFSFSRILWLSLLLMFIIGFGIMVQIAASNTLLQFLTSDDKRGRVMSFYTMAFMGMAPFGSLLAGGLASKIGSPHTVLLSGIFCIAAAFFFKKARL